DKIPSQEAVSLSFRRSTSRRPRNQAAKRARDDIASGGATRKTAHRNLPRPARIYAEISARNRSRDAKNYHFSFFTPRAYCEFSRLRACPKHIRCNSAHAASQQGGAGGGAA